LRHEAEKNTSKEKKTSPYRLTVYDNITVIVIILSIIRFTLPAIFVLKYKTQSMGSRPEPAKWSTNAAGYGM